MPLYKHMMTLCISWKLDANLYRRIWVSSTENSAREKKDRSMKEIWQPKKFVERMIIRTYV